MNEKKTLFCRWKLCLFALLICGAQLPLQARVLLKPNGANAMPLRTKSIKATVEIEGRFAATKSEMTFQNETHHQIEADFLYTVPRNAVVTYFAYYFGKEKVVARIVEKERAAQIYNFITSQNRDPALIEMMSNNVFRARIFPIMPNADLRIEMRYVEALPSSPKGALYTFPLKAEEEGKGTLEKLDVSVRIKGDGHLLGVGNNLSLSVKKSSGFYRMSLSQSNFRPKSDLRVGLKLKPQAVSTSLLSAPSGGKDGFFALMISSRVAVKKPRLNISGVKTYDVLPKVLPNMKAGGEVLVVGRYRGAGKAKISVDGISQKTPFRVLESRQFGAVPRADNMAASLWASQQIAFLSSKKNQRSRVVALSQRFTLPSKFTSWLAIPEEERRRYEMAKASLDVELYARQLAREIVARRGEGAFAKQLRQQLDKSAKVAGSDVQGALQNALYSPLSTLKSAYATEKYSKKANAQHLQTLRTDVANLARYSGISAKQALRSAELDYLTPLLEQTASVYMTEKYSLRPDEQRLRVLELKLNRLAENAGKSTKTYLQEAADERLSTQKWDYAREKYGENPDAIRVERLRTDIVGLARDSGRAPDKELRAAETEYVQEILQEATFDYVGEKYRAQPDAQRLRSLDQYIARLEKDFGTSAKEHLEEAASERSWHVASKAAGELADEVYAGRETGKKAQSLSRELKKLSSEDPDEDYRVANAYAARAHILADQILRENQKSAPDKTHLRKLNREMTRLAKAGGRKPEDVMSWHRNSRQAPHMAELSAEEVQKRYYGRDYYMRQGDPLISIDAPADAQQVVALLPGGEAKPLVYDAQSRQWQVRFDIPTYAVEGPYSITVIVVRKDGTRQQLVLRYNVDVTAPHGNGRVTSVTNNDAASLRLELEASADTTRVAAFLPWNEKVEMAPTAQHTHRFFKITAVPIEWRGRDSVVTYILTDKAHNRTTLKVDMTR